jgi:hypothetical protein
MTIKRKRQSRKIELDLTGPQGNAYVLLGTAQRLMRDLDYSKTEEDAIMIMLKAGDYEHLVKTFDECFGEYVDLFR